MADLDDLGLDSQFAEEAHEFEVDLNCVVVVNHKLTLESIDRLEVRIPPCVSGTLYEFENSRNEIG